MFYRGYILIPVFEIVKYKAEMDGIDVQKFTSQQIYEHVFTLSFEEVPSIIH